MSYALENQMIWLHLFGCFSLAEISVDSMLNFH